MIYAGIDEAGYGPMFGPLLVGRSVFEIANHSGDLACPDLWARLHTAVSRDIARRRGRVVVNDSKKVHTSSAGIAHLERGVLSFLAASGSQVASVDRLLEALGETCHRELDALPWYAPTSDRPWEPLPRACTVGELAIGRSMIAAASGESGVRTLEMGVAVVFEDRFNRMVAATRSKASTSFTFVAGHLLHVWQRYGEHAPVVAVDRQSGRTHYRELLAINFPEAQLQVLEETEQISSYRILAPRGGRSMTVHFQTEAESSHLPVALASMTAKYVRELLMARFQAWFARHAPQVRPTAGYASDAKRFWREIEPLLPGLRIEPGRLLRIS